MIRFSAALVVVALGVLVGGMVTSNLLVVYMAVGVSVAALLALALWVALNREEFFGEQGEQGERRQLALAGQGANTGQASFEQERPGSQDVFGKPFGQQAAAFGQAAWVAVPDMHAGRPSDPSRSDSPQQPTSVPHTGAEASWSRFASPVPQQPAAQTRVDATQTRVDTALTRTDLVKTRTDLTVPKADPAETKADLPETKADTAADRSAALSWFERIASARPVDDVIPAGDDIKAEDTDAADPPAGGSHAGGDALAGDAEDTTVEDEAVGTDAAADTAADADAAVEDTDAVTDEDTDAEDTSDAAADTTAEGAAESRAVGIDAEAEAEDGVQAEAADSSPDSSPDGDQEDRSGQREVTVVPGVPRYHDASCILIRFMGDDDLQKMTLDEATEAGCTPCRACMPEQA